MVRSVRFAPLVGLKETWKVTRYVPLEPRWMRILARMGTGRTNGRERSASGGGHNAEGVGGDGGRKRSYGVVLLEGVVGGNGRGCRTVPPAK